MDENRRDLLKKEEKYCVICNEDIEIRSTIIFSPCCTQPYHIRCFSVHMNRNLNCSVCHDELSKRMLNKVRDVKLRHINQGDVDETNKESYLFDTLVYNRR